VNIDKLIRDAGGLDHGTGVWLAPVIRRVQGEGESRIQMAEAVIQKKLWPDRATGSDGTALPSGFMLECLQDAIVVLRNTGYRHDADHLLGQAGKLAERYETHLALRDRHGPGESEPSSAMLFATGKVRSTDAETATWAPDAIAVSKRVRDQLRREDEIGKPMRNAAKLAAAEARNVEEFSRHSSAAMRQLLHQNNNLDGATKELIAATEQALRGDPTAAERWVRNAVHEGRSSHNYHLRAINTAAALFAIAGTPEGYAVRATPGAQLVASIGRDFVGQADVHIPAGIDNPGSNGIAYVNNGGVRVGETDRLEAWMTFGKRNEMGNRIRHLSHELGETARGELGREVLIVAANLAWDDSSPAVAEARKALRDAVPRAGKHGLRSLLEGVAQARLGLDDHQNAKLAQIIQEDVQRHPVIWSHREREPDHWLFGGDVTVTKEDGREVLEQFVPKPGKELPGLSQS